MTMSPPASAMSHHNTVSCPSVKAEHENRQRLNQSLSGCCAYNNITNPPQSSSSSVSSRHSIHPIHFHHSRSPRRSSINPPTLRRPCDRPHPHPRTAFTTQTLSALLRLLVLIATCNSLFGTAVAQETNSDVDAIDKRSTPTTSSILPAVNTVPLSLDLDFDVETLEAPALVPAWNGPSLLVVDTRPPPESPLMHLLYPDGDHSNANLYRRQNNNNKDVTTTVKSSVSSTPTPQPKFSIPQPFDASLSNNFTQPCATFWRRLLTDEKFRNCHPLSLMLQTSNSFFQASRSYVRITQTLEATCAANLNTCTSVMGGLARELVSVGNCATDYTNDNPQVLQAYNGLVAYEPIYQASCLKDKEGSFCYANAVTNTSATQDSYPYYLPLGQPLEPGARPTCNTCLQNAMAIFSSFAGNATQPISKTYNAAAAQIQISCGPSFVNKTATPMKGAAPATAASLAPTITLFLMLFLFFFQ